jgi:signal transduction histidine kinase
MTDDGGVSRDGGVGADRPVLFEALPDPAVRVGTADGEPVVRAVNAAFERVFGHDAGAVRGEALLDVVAPPAGEIVSAGAESAAGPVRTAVRRPTADGEPREFLLRSVPAPGDDEYLLYTDVTARSRREATLRGLHEATRELVRSEDREAVADRIVDACREVLGFRYVSVRYHDPDADRLVPVGVADAGREAFADPRPFERGESLAWEVLDTGEPALYGDITDHDAAVDAEIGVRSLLVLPIGDHGTLNVAAAEPDAFDEADVSTARVLAANAGTALDRLDRERALRERERDLRRQNERLDEFASVVSHDLRNPLSVAETRVAIAREVTADEAASHLDSAADALDRMERLIDGLLDLARKGQAVGETRPVAVDEAARGAWANVATADATLSVATDATVEADPERLRTLFENLFRNSVEHSSTGSRTPSGDSVERSSTSNRPSAGDSLERGSTGSAAEPHDADRGVAVEVGLFRDDGVPGLYVVDDGPGVPPAARDRVFASGHSSEDGTGIGLAVVRRIAEAHGWEARLVAGDAGGARVELCGVTIVEDGDAADRGGTGDADDADASTSAAGDADDSGPGPDPA